MTISQNGWTASSDRASIGVKNYLVDGCHAYFAVATAAAPLLIAFAEYFNAHIEPLDGHVWDEWGYNYKAIPNSTILSNHASGTAIDLNATKHNWGTANTFTIEQSKLIRAECSRLGLRWGGDYKTKIDEMHVEVNITAQAAHALIGKLALPMPKLKG